MHSSIHLFPENCWGFEFLLHPSLLHLHPGVIKEIGLIAIYKLRAVFLFINLIAFSYIRTDHSIDTSDNGSVPIYWLM